MQGCDCVELRSRACLRIGGQRNLTDAEHVRMGDRIGRRGADRACPCLTEYEMREISIFAIRAISGQRYHDNTPAAAATADPLQSVERGSGRLLLCDPAALNTCETCKMWAKREKERGGEILHSSSITATTITKK